MSWARYYKTSSSIVRAVNAIASWAYASVTQALGFADETRLGTARPLQPGMCLSFDGIDDRVSFPTISSLASKTITVEFQYATGEMQFVGITTATRYFGVTLNSTRSTSVDLVATTGETSLSGQLSKSKTGGLTVGAWYTLVCVLDASSDIVSATLDGVAMPDSTGLSRFYSAAPEHTLGRRTDGQYIYAGKIARYYVSGSVTAELESGSGRTAYDSSGNGNHGTLTGGPTWTTDKTVSQSRANTVGYSDGVIVTGTTGSYDDVQTYISSKAFSGDFSFKTRVVSAHLNAVFGLCAETAPLGGNANYNLLDIGLQMTSPTLARIWENGSFSDVSVTGLIAGAFVTFERAGSTITVKLNGLTIKTTTGSTSDWYPCFTAHANEVSVLLIGKNIDESPHSIGPDRKRVLIPRNESAQTTDVLVGDTLDYTGLCPVVGRFVGSACRVFDGVDDSVTTGAISVSGDWTVSVRISPTKDFLNYCVGLSSSPVGIYPRTDVGGVWGFFDGVSVLSTATTLTLSQWYVLTVVKSGTTFSLYLDGVFQVSGTRSNVSITKLDIGRRADDAHYFGGKIGDVRIYNTALSATDVEKIYNQTSDQPLPTVRWYPLSETGGTTAHNVLANANHGTVIGGATVGTQDVFHFNLRRGFRSGNNIPALTSGVSAADGNAITNPAISPSGHNGATTKIDFTGGQVNAPTTNFPVLNFDGTDDHVTVGTPLSAAAGTISLWAWQNTDSTSKRIISDADNYIYIYKDTTTTLAFRIWDTAYKTTAAATFTKNVWHHIVATWDSSNIKLYLDGVLIGTTAAGAITSVTATLKIGGHVNFLDGKIADCRIYNRAILLTEVEYLLRNGESGVDPSITGGMVRRYKLRSGKGTIAREEISSSNDGTLVNGPTWSYETLPTAYAFGDLLPPVMTKRVVSGTQEDRFKLVQY